MSSPTTRARRVQYRRRKPDEQDGWNSDAGMPPKLISAAAGLLGEEQSRRFSAGYLTVRDDQRNTISFAYGEEVMRSDEWGVYEPPIPQPPNRSASVRRYHQVKDSISGLARPIVDQVKQSISESTRPIVIAIEEHVPITIKRQLSTREKTEDVNLVVHEHNPRIVFGKKPTKLETMMEKSKTLSSIVDSVKRLDIRPKPKVPSNRDWDRRDEEPALLTDWRCADVSQWTEMQSCQYNEQRLVALTSRQLKELQEKSTDTVTYADPIYMVPPPTPCGSDAGSIHEEQGAEGDVFGRPEDDDPRAEHKYLHKDLRKLLGTAHTSFHIASDSGKAEEFFERNNCSSYYHEPLIEQSQDPTSELLSFVNMVDKEFQRADGLYGDEEDSDLSSNYGRNQNTFQRPRSQLPGQALIQYLLFKGLHMSKVAKILGPLDDAFMYKCESRWFKEHRIPQHTQLNDRIVEKVLTVARGEKQWWEEELDRNGDRMPGAQVLIHSRQRERKVIRFAKQSVENYLWWRLKGEQPHRDVKSGAMMRKGEY